MGNGAGEPGLRLLPRHALVKTGVLDHADWNYRPLLGRIQRLRFRLALSLLPPGRVGRLLEIGYGSGVFLPELARHCWELHAADPHPRLREVGRALARAGIRARLHHAPAERLPFQTRSFDVVVAVSVLEFVADIERVCLEVRRVLRPVGCFVVVTPGLSALACAGVSLLSGTDAGREFGRGREAIRPALREHFALEREIVFPPLGGPRLRWYDSYRLSPLRLFGMMADVLAGREPGAAEEEAPAPEPVS